MTMQSPTLNGHSFYIRQAGRTRGPVTARELVELARVGGLDPHAEISPDQKTWRRAARVKGLMELRFIGAAPPRNAWPMWIVIAAACVLVGGGGLTAAIFSGMIGVEQLKQFVAYLEGEPAPPQPEPQAANGTLRFVVDAQRDPNLSLMWLEIDVTNDSSTFLVEGRTYLIFRDASGEELGRRLVTLEKVGPKSTTNTTNAINLERDFAWDRVAAIDAVSEPGGLIDAKRNDVHEQFEYAVKWNAEPGVRSRPVASPHKAPAPPPQIPPNPFAPLDGTALPDLDTPDDPGGAPLPLIDRGAGRAIRPEREPLRGGAEE